MEEKRTKIVATIGPASSSVTVLTRMIQAGMNICRLNFSHGTHVEHKKLIKNIRAASRKTKEPVAILQDLQGPRIRMGVLPEGGIALKQGSRVSLQAGKTYEKGAPLPVTYRSLHRDVKKGHRILINDGRVELQVTGLRKKTVFTKVVVGGQISSNKGINLPDSDLSVSSFTEKDKDDLLFGLEQGIDWVALSFVTSSKVIVDVRKLIAARCRALGCSPPKIMAKIERREAVEDFLEILDVVDGIMLARGDLGLEIPFEEVPIVQKELTEICRQSGKPIVVATHMLDSMATNARATRAEISDVANAVFDHADAVMLSQESAAGEYPYLSVKTMATVIEEAERSRLDDISFYSIHDSSDIATSIAQTLHVMAENNQIQAIVSADAFGPVAQKINVFRPVVPIFLACKDASAVRKMQLRSGVYPVVGDSDPGSFVMRMDRLLRKNKKIRSKDRVAYITSSPHGQMQLTIK